MPNYIKTFTAETDYQAFKNGVDFVTPNVSLVEEAGLDLVHFNSYVPPAPIPSADFGWSQSVVTATTKSATLPTFTNTHNVPVTFSTSDSGVATISNAGVVTIVENGDATVTASFSGDSEYGATVASYSLTVDIVPPTVAGQVCYYDTSASKLKYVDYANWDNSLGTAVGIVVVPSNHTPDGSTRILAISGVTSAGTATTSEQRIAYRKYVADCGLPKLNKVPIFDNTAGATISNNTSGYLPSDKGFTGATCVTDTTTKYGQPSNLVPSPYLSDGTQNPDYINTVGATTANCLSDFDGSGNTTALVAIGTDCIAASACSLYSTTYLTAGHWYLPACGELGYIIPRFNVINAALQAVGGVQLQNSSSYLSSTEQDYYNVRSVNTIYGIVGNSEKASSFAAYVRPFASVSSSGL